MNIKELKDIDGNIIGLKDAILDYEDKYGDGLSVIGGLIKKDLLGQLDISLDVMKNIEDILKKLNISDFYQSNFTIDPTQINTNDNGRSVSSPTINFNDSLITVNGNIDRNVMNDLERFGNKLKQELTGEILRAVKR